MILTPEERNRFATYLELDAESNFKIVEQMEKINTPAFVIEKYKTDATASLIVARKLRNTGDY
ncbi:MAG TPA: hypothetical protein VLF94_07500 [Chlamydiales bacterium]|nr:hypothetical protein [Chlamydiales bacterium]